MKVNSSRLPGLDALRGIAALAVVLYHITLGRPQGEHFFKFGFTGVDLFFMISGFVICMSFGHVKNGGEFTFRRVTRLYPAYWVAVTLTSLIVAAVGIEHINKAFAVKYLANLTMFHPYLGQDHTDGSYWTLIVEMQFYIFMLLVYQLGRFKAIEQICFFVLLLLIAFGCFIHYHQLSPAHLLLIYKCGSIIICFPLFFAGILYYKLMYDKKTLTRYLLLALCFITQLNFNTFDPRLQFVKPYQYYILILVFNGMFLLFINNKLKLHINKVTLFFGKISYPLYLINMIITIKVLIPYLTRHISFWPAAFIDLAVLIGLSYLINIWVEKPVQAYARGKWLAKHKVVSDGKTIY